MVLNSSMIPDPSPRFPGRCHNRHPSCSINPICGAASPYFSLCSSGWALLPCCARIATTPACPPAAAATAPTTAPCPRASRKWPPRPPPANRTFSPHPPPAHNSPRSTRPAPSPSTPSSFPPPPSPSRRRSLALPSPYAQPPPRPHAKPAPPAPLPHPSKPEPSVEDFSVLSGLAQGQPHALIPPAPTSGRVRASVKGTGFSPYINTNRINGL